MTPATISGMTLRQHDVDAGGVGTPEQLRVARDFEAIFMRQLLSSMEKGAALAGAGTGAGVYRSMMVGALADSAAAGGGIGLAELVLEAMVRASGAPVHESEPGAAGAVSHRGATPGSNAAATRLAGAVERASGHASERSDPSYRVAFRAV